MKQYIGEGGEKWNLVKVKPFDLYIETEMCWAACIFVTPQGKRD